MEPLQARLLIGKDVGIIWVYDGLVYLPWTAS